MLALPDPACTTALHTVPAGSHACPATPGQALPAQRAALGVSLQAPTPPSSIECGLLCPPAAYWVPTNVSEVEYETAVTKAGKASRPANWYTATAMGCSCPPHVCGGSRGISMHCIQVIAAVQLAASQMLPEPTLGRASPQTLPALPCPAHLPCPACQCHCLPACSCCSATSGVRRRMGCASRRQCHSPRTASE